MKIKKFFCLLLTAVLFASGCSCADSGEREKTVNYDKYTLICDGGKTYMTINIQKDSEGMDGTAFLGGIEFDSIEQFVDVVTNGKLTDSQLETMNRVFPKDESGRIKIIDMSNIYTLTTPEDMVCKGVFWRGESYSLRLYADNGASASAHFYDNDSFRYRYDKDFSAFFENPLISEPSRTESQDGKNINYYSTSKGEFKRIDYVIQKDNIKYTVVESYNLTIYDESLKCSDTIPFEINVFYEANDCKCIIDIFNLEVAPSESWITDFVARRYIAK